MKIRTVMAAYFSPAGSTAKVTKAAAEGIAEVLGANLREFNWTVKKNREWRLTFGPSDLLVAGVPTYAGRIPNKVMPYIKENLLVDDESLCAAPGEDLHAVTAGGGARVFAVPVATYGGRDFENSLAETAGLLAGNGFTIAGGAAVPCEHVFSSLLQPGRPEEADLAAVRTFGKQVGEKVARFIRGEEETAWKEPVLPGAYAPEKYYQPVDLNGAPTDFLKVKPALSDRRCIGCGRCQSVCPLESIAMEKCTLKIPFGGSVGGLGRPDLAAMKVQRPAVKGICIKCQACVKTCPHGAWAFKDEAFLRHVKMLERTFGGAERDCAFYL